MSSRIGKYFVTSAIFPSTSQTPTSLPAILILRGCALAGVSPATTIRSLTTLPLRRRLPSHLPPTWPDFRSSPGILPKSPGYLELTPLFQIGGGGGGWLAVLARQNTCAVRRVPCAVTLPPVTGQNPPSYWELTSLFSIRAGGGGWVNWRSRPPNTRAPRRQPCAVCEQAQPARKRM